MTIRKQLVWLGVVAAAVGGLACGATLVERWDGTGTVASCTDDDQCGCAPCTDSIQCAMGYECEEAVGQGGAPCTPPRSVCDDD